MASGAYTTDPTEDIKRRLIAAGGLVIALFAFGTAGYKAIGGPGVSLLDCAYMTVITVGTVGFGEVTPHFSSPGGRLFTMFMILAGLGTFGYAISTFTAFIVEGEMQLYFRRKRMEKSIAAMSGHVIVCGGGETGAHTIGELLACGWQPVAVDKAPQRVIELRARFGERVPVVEADATDDETLDAAGCARAYGLVACLANDKDNLYLTVAARQHNPKLRVVARNAEQKSEDKLRKAGADAAVSPNRIGGLRLASEMIRPTVVSFLDRMLRDKAQKRVEEVTLPQGTMFHGKTVAEADLRKSADLLLLAVENGHDTVFDPRPETRLEAGMTLIVMGAEDEVWKLRKAAAGK